MAACGYAESSKNPPPRERGRKREMSERKQKREFLVWRGESDSDMFLCPKRGLYHPSFSPFILWIKAPLFSVCQGFYNGL